MTTKRLELALSSVHKFVSAGTRRVRGFASTDAVDRVGDVVEPTGGKWKVPLPLLWQHKHDMPIGWVRSVEVRARGLWIEAELAEGLGKADEAWQMVEAGLVTGFSIGFIAQKSEPLPTGGKRFTQWEMHEVSCVTIPANPDASIRRNLPGIPLVTPGIPLTGARNVG
jgi:HK97 family phage prohead protease